MNNYSQLRGGVVVSQLGHDCKQMWKFHFFLVECNTQNTVYLVVKNLKNALLIPFTPLLYCYPTVLWQSSSISNVSKSWEFLQLDFTPEKLFSSISEYIKSLFKKKHIFIPKRTQGGSTSLKIFPKKKDFIGGFLPSLFHRYYYLAAR